jgi:hypothetical protein
MILQFKEWVYNNFPLLAESTISQLIKNDKDLSARYESQKNINQILKPENWPNFLNPLNDNNKISLKKLLFYRVIVKKDPEAPNFTVSPLNAIDVMAVDPNSFVKQYMSNPDFAWINLQQKNDEYHTMLKQSKNRSYGPEQHEAPLTILKNYSNGFAWARFESGYCQQYGKSMAHCGNAGRKDGDKIYTFFDQKTHIHYLTFIVNDGLLGEAKAYENSKPPAKSLSVIGRPDLTSLPIQPYYKDFFLLQENGQYVIQSIKGGGYKPENNLTFKDLEPQYQEEIEEAIPDINNYHEIRFQKEKKKLKEIEKSNQMRNIGVHYNIDWHNDSEFYIDLGASIDIEFDNKSLTPNAQEIFEQYKGHIRKEIPEILKRWLAATHQDSTEIYFSEGKIFIQCYYSSNFNSSAEDYQYWINDFMTPDEEYSNIKSAVYAFLRKLGITKPSVLQKSGLLQNEISNSDKETTFKAFENLALTYKKKYESYIISDFFKVPIDTKIIDDKAASKLFKKAAGEFVDIVVNLSKKIRGSEDAQMNLFKQKQFQPTKVNIIDKNNLKIEVNHFQSLSDKNAITFEYYSEINHATEPSVLHNTINFYKLLDKYYDKLIPQIQKMINNHLSE